MLKKTVVIVLALALAVCGTAVFGQQAPGGTAGPGGPMRTRTFMMSCPAMAIMPPQAQLLDRAETLRLSEEQKEKLRTILTRSEDILMPLRQKAAESSRALREAILAPTYDERRVAQLAADAEKAEAAVVSAEIQTWTQIRTILTPDQLSGLQELTSRRMMPGQGPSRRGAGQEGPPPPRGE